MAPTMIAHIGGSLTERPVKGVHAVYGAGQPWWPTEAYHIGMGSVDRWITVSTYFAQFDAQCDRIPPDAIWYNPLWHDPSGGVDAYTDTALDVLARIRSRVGPDMPIYVSPMFIHSANSCPGVLKAEDWSVTVAETLRRDGGCLQGPTLRPLSPTYLARGKCDQNKAGRELHGRDLHDWYVTL